MTDATKQFLIALVGEDIKQEQFKIEELMAPHSQRYYSSSLRKGIMEQLVLARTELSQIKPEDK